MFTRKQFTAFIAPIIKAVHWEVNKICLSQKPTIVPGWVKSHEIPGETNGVEWEGFVIEISHCSRPRVVCNVPTPFSLFTFTYCLKQDGKPIAYGQTIPEFTDAAFRAFRKQGLAR